MLIEDLAAHVAGKDPDELVFSGVRRGTASGADVKVVQQMLGHSSAIMTMDTYGHLFENRLDEVADAMDAARWAARAPGIRRSKRPSLLPTRF